MPENIGDELPHALNVLWGRAEPKGRGRTPALSLERIVAAAVALADEEGLAALSMARLAERLGCAPMSLYRHVAGKDDLQLFMLAAAPGPPPEFGTAPADWRGSLTRWAVELLGVYLRHPWIVQLVNSPPVDPGQLAWLDAALRTLGGTPLDPRTRFSVVMLVLHYVRGAAQLLTSMTTAEPEERADEAYAALLAELADPGRFPALARAVEAGVFAPHPGAGPDDDFRAGLDHLLDGVGMAIERAARA
ncbi:TetR/AcrR family transcriptional regulator [Streptosporangium pseudovulgare]|uniref:TetR family transcriptional regulator n=1 Tax=Streptosporangium pseudovulgare TaxID=35765 RepID=A0ABQ2RN83_9ACTN|nr:TetR/AcrR family transcriptional regulator [Streptosporangium pseudovulgare]GGQ35163.1 TetR family transcriptional regulator [Streptosporangium pseudovulgare]